MKAKLPHGGSWMRTFARVASGVAAAPCGASAGPALRSALAKRLRGGFLSLFALRHECADPRNRTSGPDSR